jgi:8-amino-7-oxononanoate synthase
MFAERYGERLRRRQEGGLLRTPPLIAGREGKYLLIGGRRVLNFSSNDYLGLGVSAPLRRQVARNFQKYGTSSSSSRLVAGNLATIVRAEEAYARYFGYEAALFFPSGYQANVGLISALFAKGDVLLFDKHLHASSVKGMALSGADCHGYNHNSMSHLRKRLAGARQEQAAVLTESLFSMDGDFLAIQGFDSLKKEFGFFSIVDEAHAFGVLGEQGRGLARSVADIAVGTFGKALGLFGAFVLLPALLKEYLGNFSSPLIYSTALPEAHAASALDILATVAAADKERDHLREISGFMKSALLAEGLHATGDAHIIAWDIGDEKRAVAMSQQLLARDIFAFAARHPTVPLGRAMLRLGMTALHTEEDVTIFINAVRDISRHEVGPEVGENAGNKIGENR